MKTFFKLLVIFLSVILFFSTFFAFAEERKPIFIMDPYFCLPTRFRTTDDIPPLRSRVSTVGLSDLHIIGSGQFSAMQLERVIKKIKAPIIVVDLRQESHGFIDGVPVTWYGERNWANYGKSDKEIECIEHHLLEKLKSQKKLQVYKGFEEKGDETGKGAVYGEQVTLKVVKVLSERELAHKLGVGYKRFFIPDHSIMTDQQVDQFVKFVKKIPKETYVYFHCRGGIGRTTTLMVMYDMIKNAKRVSLMDILKRQQLIGGRDLTSEFKGGYKAIEAKKRLILIKKFYKYCRDNNDNFQTSWTSWLKMSIVRI